jgi:hypothetical protein
MPIQTGMLFESKKILGSSREGAIVLTLNGGEPALDVILYVQKSNKAFILERAIDWLMDQLQPAGARGRRGTLTTIIHLSTPDLRGRAYS